MSDGARLATAAANLIGSKFRLYGRDPETGLDCVGLVIASLRSIDRKPKVPTGYRLQNTSIDRWLKLVEPSGLREAAGDIEPGDVLLIQPGPGQHHLLIAESTTTAIHAHARIRRVVRQPMDRNARVLARWRLSAKPKEY